MPWRNVPGWAGAPGPDAQAGFNFVQFLLHFLHLLVHLLEILVHDPGQDGPGLFREINIRPANGKQQPGSGKHQDKSPFVVACTPQKGSGEHKNAEPG
jgi:hypothetical protein